jgi:DNA-binding Xre family transcriptional regulator
MTTLTPDAMLRVYSRNIEILAIKRGWNTARVAAVLGVTANTLRRVRQKRNRYIDPELLAALIDVFECTPNDLLLPQAGIDYSSDATCN